MNCEATPGNGRPSIAFIGGGNMASALITGLAKSGPGLGEMHVGDPDAEVRDRLERSFDVRCHESAAEAVEGAEVIVLAVKPQVVPRVLGELAGRLAPDQLVVSVAAGISVATLRRGLGAKHPVIRTMPNTPALVGQGITGLYAPPACRPSHRASAERIMGAVGETVWVEDEALMDVVTAISGSGPAYFYLLVEALRDAGEELGLDRSVATRLALHTAHGAGVMALQSDTDVGELRRRVTSPGGTTEAALEVLEQGGFEALILLAAQAATRRGRELAEEGEAQ